MIFTKAAALMSHIEYDECELIPLAQFSRQRAEKQIIKDLWEATLDPSEASTVPKETEVGSQADSNPGGVSLLDEGRTNEDYSRRASGVSGAGPQPLQPISSQQYTAPEVPVQALANISLTRFPALPTQKHNAISSYKEHYTLGDDLIDLDELPGKPRRKAQIPLGVWGSQSSASKSLFKGADAPSPTMIRSDDALEKQSSLSTNSNGNQPGTMFDWLNQQSPPPPLQQGQRRDRHVKTALASVYASQIDPYQYYNHIIGKFACPGVKCGRSFTSPDAFLGHLNAGAHVGGKTNCPSCLGDFNNTASLIAHCESGSKKCNIRKSANYNQVMRELTGGLIGTAGHYEDGSIQYTTTKDEGFW